MQVVLIDCDNVSFGGSLQFARGNGSHYDLGKRNSSRIAVSEPAVRQCDYPNCSSTAGLSEIAPMQDTQPVILPSEFRFLAEGADFSKLWGKITMRGHTVLPSADYSPPPLNYTAGAIVFAAFSAWPGTTDDGAYVLYAAQTHGPEPLDEASQGQKNLKVEVLRFVTDDLRSYRSPTVCLKFTTGSRASSIDTI